MTEEAPWPERRRPGEPQERRGRTEDGGDGDSETLRRIRQGIRRANACSRANLTLRGDPVLRGGGA